MALMTWSGKYSVGVEALDNQHKAMLKVLNELHAAAMRGKAQEVADHLMSQMDAISKEHFSAEERLMESIRFPGLDCHRAKHQELGGKLEEFTSRHQMSDASMYVPLLYFVRDWLTKHMQTDDQAYASWLRSHRAQ